MNTTTLKLTAEELRLLRLAIADAINNPLASPEYCEFRDTIYTPRLQALQGKVWDALASF